MRRKKLRGGEGFLAASRKKGVEEMKKKTEEQTKKKGMYLVATFGAVAFIALGALAVGMINQGTPKGGEPIDLNATPTPGLQKQAEVAKQDTTPITTPEPTLVPWKDKKDDGTEKTVTDLTQIAEVLPEEEGAEVLNPDGIIKGLNFSAETGMLWPITGEVLLPFSPDHGIYHKTLDSYRTSEYVLLGGEAGTHVSAAADGVVTEIREDIRTGLTVAMQVSADHKIVYGMLSDVVVAEGDFVDAGTVFATVAEPTRYFVEDGAGIYLQVLENGKAVNPMLYLR